MFCVIKWRKVAAILMLVVICELTLCVYMMFGREPTRSAASVGCTIVVDAGHGGIDGGVIAADGTKESDLNLTYANTLGRKLAKPATVCMGCRPPDSNVATCRPGRKSLSIRLQIS